MVFLHGAGTRCNDLEVLKRNACFTNLRLHQDRGFLLAAPLCEVHDWNEVMETVIAWIAELRALPYVDTDRVYLTGNSMGGYGTWELASIHPEWFAAIMPRAEAFSRHFRAFTPNTAYSRKACSTLK